MLYCSQMFSRSHELCLGGNEANTGMSGNEIPEDCGGGTKLKPYVFLYERGREAMLAIRLASIQS